MKNEIKSLLAFIILIPIISVLKSNAQGSISIAEHSSAKKIWDIPHKTAKQKLMWLPRSFAFEITKEHVINYDTAYIQSYHKRLVISLPISTQFLKFSLIDFKSVNKLIFVPNINYNLGVSVSSRWASFTINTGIEIFNHDIDIKGITKYQDFQLNLYSRKFTTEMYVQYYNGFYIKNSSSFTAYISDKPYDIRSDVNALNIGISSYYIINHRRISFGNSFAFVEQQKKSAGSFLFGLYYFYFAAAGSPSLITSPFKNSFDSLSLIQNGHTNNFGLNFGYIYTFVFFKRCYATASIVQGIGGEQLFYKRDDNSIYNQLLGGAAKLNMRFALGYDNGRYFIGSMGMFDYLFSNQKTNATFEYSFGQFMIYIGYRFSVLKTEKKLLHHFKLIDY